MFIDKRKALQKFCLGTKEPFVCRVVHSVVQKKTDYCRITIWQKLIHKLITITFFIEK